MVPFRNIFRISFQAASVVARVARLFVSVWNTKLSGKDSGRSTVLDTA